MPQGLTEREGASQRCPRCRQSFRVLADEVGSHPCPRCGYFPGDDDDVEGVER
jgi:hypothetical protein